jgi:hypothetical protein
MKLPEWITGCSGVLIRPNGSGPRLQYRGVDEALKIGLTLVADRLALLIELDQIVALDQFRCA